MTIRIGVICPSEIAFRRFLPALKKNDHFTFVGLSKASKEEWFCDGSSDADFYRIDEANTKKAEDIISQYPGALFNSYHEMISSGKIDAIYIPLPPELHYKWAKLALENGLHVLVEKPSTTSFDKTYDLVKTAKDRKLALHENYMFMFHSQIKTVDEVIKSGKIGETRLIRVDFGFPDRGKNDFRYDKDLGGGALFDCGGYVLKYADYLLGGKSDIVHASLNSKPGYDVDIYGCGTLAKNNKCVQFSFGMDNDYRCSIDVWGSKGTLKSNRILTAPAGFEPSYQIIINGESKEYRMDSDDAFYNSIERFYDCMQDDDARLNNYETLLNQERLVRDFWRMANEEKE